MTALDTSTPREAIETPEGLNSTGWSFDQYMGRTDATHPASPSMASSKGTRASERLRKPTTRAIESQQTEMARTKATAPKSTNKGRHEPAKDVAAQRTNDTEETILPATSLSTLPTIPAEASTTPNAAKPTKGTKTKGQKGKKPAKAQTPQVKDAPAEDALVEESDFDQEAIDQFLLDLRLVFHQPPDPNDIEFVDRCEAQWNWEREASVKLHTLAKTSDPTIDGDGWVRTGRVNAAGEEVLMAPSVEGPYWCAQTYDENLPTPPVRSRPIAQAHGDATLGFPPRLGDRNVPCDFDPQVANQDFWASAPRLTPSRASQPAAAPAPVPAPAPAPAPAASTRAQGKRRQSAPSPAPETDSAQPAEDSKQRSRRARASSSKVASARVSTKANKTAIKAQDPISLQGADGAADGENVPPTFPRLKLSQPRPEASAAVDQSPSTTKGKKRAVGMMAGEPVPDKGPAAKRPRLASGIDSGANEPPKRASSTKKRKQRL